MKSGEDGVLIVRYPDGRASGDAFAIFEQEAHLEEALKLNRSNIGSRYVELYKSSVKEFQLVRCHCVSVHVSVCVYMYMYVCMYVHMCGEGWVCMHVCVCV